MGQGSTLQKKIQELFGNDYIPTWDNGPKLNGEIIPNNMVYY